MTAPGAMGLHCQSSASTLGSLAHCVTAGIRDTRAEELAQHKELGDSKAQTALGLPLLK